MMLSDLSARVVTRLDATPQTDSSNRLRKRNNMRAWRAADRIRNARQMKIDSLNKRLKKARGWADRIPALEAELAAMKG